MVFPLFIPALQGVSVLRAARRMPVLRRVSSAPLLRNEAGQSGSGKARWAKAAAALGGTFYAAGESGFIVAANAVHA
jgi:hypothetical protein